MEPINNKIILISGTSKGIGKYLAHYYCQAGYQVIGCSRNPVDYNFDNYLHFSLDITDEVKVKNMFTEIRKDFKRLDILINNAAIFTTNHSLLTPLSSVDEILRVNVSGTFLLCRDAAKLMQRQRFGRIVNFTTLAVPLKLGGEAIYAASKAAVITLTQIMAREFASFGVTVNAIGPTPIKTDMIHAVPEEKIDNLLKAQAIHRFGELRDISNVIDFFIKPESDFITGQVIYLGGI